MKQYLPFPILFLIVSASHSQNVGVGTSTPTAKLDVLGPATGTGITIKAGGGGDVVLNSGGSLFFDGNYSYATGNYIRPLSANTQAFFTGGAERMRINSSGNIGIGCTVPQGRLDVCGDIYGINEYSFTGYSEAINNWDYSGLQINPTGNSVTDDSWYIQSNSSNWDRGLQSRRKFRRTPGLTLEYEAWMDAPLGGNVHYMVGFVDGNSGSYSYCQNPSNLMYHDNAGLSVYENCSSQGSDYSFDTRNAWWRFKVVLKGQGADYYVFRNNGWNVVKSTSNNSNKYVKVLVSAYHNRFFVRNMRVYQENSGGEGLTGSYVKNQISAVQPASNFWISGIGQSSGDFRSPIYYDLNNTGYYVDPASTSNINEEYSNTLHTGYIDFRYAGGNSGHGNNAYAIFQEGGAWSWPYPDLRIAYHTGIKLGANASYNGIRFYNDYDMTGLVMAVNDGSTSGANNVYMAGTLGIGQANTGYRLTVGGDAYINGGWVRVTGNQGLYFESYGGGLWMVDGSWIRTYGGKNFYHDQGSFRTDGQLEVGSGGGTFYCTNGGNMAYRSNVLFANTAGRVAINSTAPLTTFDVYGPCYTGADVTYHAVSGTYSGYDVLVYPSINATGFVGLGQAWWRMYSYGYNLASQREKKRSITPIENELSDYVMNDIDKLQPYFYKYKEETDAMESGNENRCRPQMHIGLMVDESPDYILDESYKSVELYGVASLAIAGVKHNRNEINKLKEAVALSSRTVQDFGTVTMNGTELWIPFSDDFKKYVSEGNKPVITLTPNQFVQLIVSEKKTEGFRVRASSPVNNLDIDWLAAIKITAPAEANASISKAIPPELQNQLTVPEAEKEKLIQYWNGQHEAIETRKK